MLIVFLPELTAQVSMFLQVYRESKIPEGEGSFKRHNLIRIGSSLSEDLETFGISSSSDW